jgi:shikimate kinase
LVISRQGRSIPDIFKSDGEEGFRRAETEALEEALKNQKVVIAAGGGVLLREINRKLLEGRTVVNLNASFEELSKRVTGAKTERPLAKGPVEEFRKRFDERKPLYDAVERQVETERKSPEQIAEEIISRFMGQNMEQSG